MAMPFNQTLLGSLLKGRDEKREKEKSDSQEAQTLRKLMSIYTPERKDQFTTMDLADLRGEAQGFAVKSAVAKQRRDELKAQQEEQSGAALSRVLQDAGSLNESEVLAEGNGPVRQTRRPVAMTPQRLQTVLARNPAAVNAENFAPTISSLRALMGEAAGSGAGPVEFTTDSDTGTRYAFNRKTGQFGVDPNSRAKANADAEANKTRFSVKPIMDKFGRAAGYGVEAQFGSEEEAKAWADKQNQGGGASVPASQYKSADEVKAALKAGKLDKAAAVEILRKQFGYQ